MSQQQQPPRRDEEKDKQCRNCAMRVIALKVVVAGALTIVAVTANNPAVTLIASHLLSVANEALNDWRNR